MKNDISIQGGRGREVVTDKNTSLRGGKDSTVKSFSKQDSTSKPVINVDNLHDYSFSNKHIEALKQISSVTNGQGGGGPISEKSKKIVYQKGVTGNININTVTSQKQFDSSSQNESKN